MKIIKVTMTFVFFVGLMLMYLFELITNGFTISGLHYLIMGCMSLLIMEKSDG